METRIGI
jgi:hypothetical protein